MKLPFFLVLGMLIAAAAWAQPSQRVEEAQEHRRSELRLALQAARERAFRDDRKVTARPDPARVKMTEHHLSVLERDNLRQQLRQQRHDPGGRSRDRQD